MTTLEIFENSNGVEMILIRHTEDDGFTTMPKSVYDEQQAQTQQFTPIIEVTQ
jgi:hypothetical protein